MEYMLPIWILGAPLLLAIINLIVTPKPQNSTFRK